MAIDRQKVVPTPGVFNMFTSTCASRHNGVHFVDILTSKTAPNLECFVHFHFQMCFAPQRPAFLDTSTSKSLPAVTVFHTFHLHMCIARNGVHVSTSQLPKVLRMVCFAKNWLRATTACTRNLQKWSETDVFRHF